jgi:hypothetical protein
LAVIMPAPILSDSVDLVSLGASLDDARRARRPPDHPPLISTISSSDDTSLSMANKCEESPSEDVERPYPLCLLCLARPPSAVLLPCKPASPIYTFLLTHQHQLARLPIYFADIPGCHLNLCYICAPLLLHQTYRTPLSSPASTSPSQHLPSLDHSDSPTSDMQPEDALFLPRPRPTNPFPSLSAENHITESRDPPSASDISTSRVSWNTLLLRATASHPKSRKLALGGYLAPRVSVEGGEVSGTDLLPDTSETGDRTDGNCAGPDLGQNKLGFHSAYEPPREDATELRATSLRRVMLSPCDDVRRRLGSGDGRVVGGARCFVCRARVQGWLRVYTG